MNLNFLRSFRNVRGRSADAGPGPSTIIANPASNPTANYRGAGHSSRLAEQEARLTAEINALYPSAEQKPSEAPKPEPVKDEFEARFKCAPYYEEGRNFDIGRPFLYAMSDLVGIEIYTAEEIEQLTKLGKRWDAALANLCEYSRDAVRHRFYQIVAENEKAISRGESPAETGHLEERYREAELKRQQAKGELKATGVLTKPILTGICNRLAEAAKKAAVILDDQEREAAARMGAPFYPSFQLAACVWFALEGAKRQVENFNPGTMGSPNEVLFGTLHHSNHQPKR